MNRYLCVIGWKKSFAYHEAHARLTGCLSVVSVSMHAINNNYQIMRDDVLENCVSSTLLGRFVRRRRRYVQNGVNLSSCFVSVHYSARHLGFSVWHTQRFTQQYRERDEVKEKSY